MAWCKRLLEHGRAVLFFWGGGGSTRNNLMWCIWHLWFQWDKTSESYCKLHVLLPFFPWQTIEIQTRLNKKKSKTGKVAELPGIEIITLTHSTQIWFDFVNLPCTQKGTDAESSHGYTFFKNLTLLEGWAERIFTCIKAKNNEPIFFNYFASCSEINQSSKIT